MGPVPTSYTLIAAIVVALLMPAATRMLAIRIAVLWAGSAAAIFLIPNKGIAFAVIGGLLVAAAPFQPAERTRFFLATFFAIPQDYTTTIPFPGLNHLVFLDMGLLSALLVLTPAAAGMIGKPPPKGLRLLDALVLLYVLVNGALSLRDVSFTSAIRQAVILYFTIWLPYFCITRTHRTREDLERTLIVFLQGLAMLAAIGLISTLKRWNYYGAHFGALSAKFFFDIRNGFLRILGTLYWPLYGLLMGYAVPLVLYLATRKRVAAPVAWGMAAVFALCCFATGTRGAWIGAAVAVAGYVFLNFANSPLRVLALVAGCGGAVYGAFMLASGDLEIKDYTGNFEYRARLMQVGVRQVMEAPLLGVPNVTELPQFQPLRQGEGIIDIVNLYLLITLYTGFVGLCAFLAPVLAAVGKGLKALAVTDRRAKERDIRELRRVVSLLVALIAGLLVMSVTTSNAGYLYTFYFLVIGLTASSAVAVRTYLDDESEVQAPPPEAAPPSAPPPAKSVAPKPYGARLVHRV